MVILELNFYCFFLYFFFLFLQLLLEMLHEFTDGFVHKLIIFFMLRQSVYFLIGLQDLSLKLQLVFRLDFPLCMIRGQRLKFPEFRVKCLVGKQECLRMLETFLIGLNQIIQLVDEQFIMLHLCLLVMNDFFNLFLQPIVYGFILDRNIFFYDSFSIFIMFGFC